MAARGILLSCVTFADLHLVMLDFTCSRGGYPCLSLPPFSFSNHTQFFSDRSIESGEREGGEQRERRERAEREQRERRERAEREWRDRRSSIAGLVGFMGNPNGDLWGLIFTHKSLSGFMGIYG